MTLSAEKEKKGISRSDPPWKYPLRECCICTQSTASEQQQKAKEAELEL